LRGWLHRAGTFGLFRVARDVVVLSFRGSRSDLERVTARRLEAAALLVVLAARVVHLGQAGVDLALAGHIYTHERLALGLGAACLIESALFAAVSLHARRLTRRALLGDALFGVVGLGVMSVATSATFGRAGSLNWMLPYTVTTAVGLGLVALGDLAGRSAPAKDASPAAVGPRSVEVAVGTDQQLTTGRFEGLWALGVALALGCSYVASAYLPHRLADEDPAQIWGNAANYPVFFAAAVGAAVVLRRRLSLISSRNAEVTRAAADIAHLAQWRAVAVDVFGPVIDLLDRVVDLDDGEIPAPLRDEADRLITMIDAVRPLDGNLSGARGIGNP
jgi:hypothetical protein